MTDCLCSKYIIRVRYYCRCYSGPAFHLLAWASVPITLSLLLTVDCYISSPGNWQPGCDCGVASPAQRGKEIGETGYRVSYAGRLRAAQWAGRLLKQAQQQQCPVNDLDLLVQWQFNYWACVYMTLYHWQHAELCLCVKGRVLFCHIKRHIMCLFMYCMYIVYCIVYCIVCILCSFLSAVREAVAVLFMCPLSEHLGQLEWQMLPFRNDTGCDVTALFAFSYS